MKRSLALFLCVLLMVEIFAGCTSWRTSENIRQEVLTEKIPKKVRVTLKDSRTAVLKHAFISGERLTGQQEAGVETDPDTGKTRYLREEQVEVPLHDIALLEIHELDGTTTSIVMLGLVAVVVGSVVFIQAMNSSFGGDGGLFGGS